MSLNQEVARHANRFRNISINHPVGISYSNGNYTLTQGGKKWITNSLITYSFKPSKFKGYLLPTDIKKFLAIEDLLSSTEADQIFIVPEGLTFKVYKLAKNENPILVEELNMISIKNKLIVYLLGFTPRFKVLYKNINNIWK